MTLKIKFAPLLLIAMAALTFSCNQPQTKTETSSTTTNTGTDPLASWNEGTTKKFIANFVNKTTKESSVNYVPIVDRIVNFN
jgi:hypothetical protein